MNFFKYFFALVFLSASVSAQNETVTSNLILEFEDDAFKELSLSEWKKFKRFEQKLVRNPRAAFDEEQLLRGYARDSIQILGVKLMAVKLLDDKKLLDRDIAENAAYYAALLEELRKSGIPKTEYLFLEEKMAFINQNTLERQLGQSRWLIAGLLALCLSLIYVVLRLRTRYRKSKAPMLSRQEMTVRSLILQGKSNKEIANELFISLSTVKSHITNLYAKLNVANRQELFQKSTGAST